MNIHAISGIRTRHPIKTAASAYGLDRTATVSAQNYYVTVTNYLHLSEWPFRYDAVARVDMVQMASYRGKKGDRTWTRSYA